MSNCLLLSNVTKMYQKRDANSKCTMALRKVSFEFTSGLYGLLGPNGSGKSTMIHIITGGLKQTSGIVLWNKVPILKCGPGFYSILGFMPQQQDMYDSFTGRRFLEYFCILKNLNRSIILNEVKRTADLVHLTAELDKRLSAYSGGMRQRLLIAQALLGNPQLLIFDEPTAGLDPKERVSLRNVLKAEAEKGKIVIVATHVVSDVESVADQIIFLKKGIVVNHGCPADLVKEYTQSKDIEDVYLQIFGEDEE